MVVKAARGTEHHLRTGAHDGAVLVHSRASAVQTLGAQARAHTSKDVVRLHSELSARHNNHRLNLVEGGVELGSERQEVGKRLAAARRSQHHDVLVAVQHSPDSVLLHIVKSFDAQLLEGCFYVHCIVDVFCKEC